MKFEMKKCQYICIVLYREYNSGFKAEPVSSKKNKIKKLKKVECAMKHIYKVDKKGQVGISNWLHRCRFFSLVF
jgi:hypothetical protein